MAAPAPSLRVVVIDDDPTGSQLLHGIPLVTDWTAADLRWALTRPEQICVVMTNSRALTSGNARELARRLGVQLANAAAQLRCTLRIISRADSTLRGHFPAELDGLQAGLAAAGQPPYDGVLLCPAFPEAGRVTIGDIHLVRVDGQFRPAAETEYARDAAFGYRESDLRRWTERRLQVPQGDVRSLSLTELRSGGPDEVARRIGQLRNGRVMTANALTPEDIEVLARGVKRAEESGCRVLVRCSPSFVKAYAELPPATRTALPSLPAAGRRRGLIVVGSHTSITTRQLDEVLSRSQLPMVEVPVDRLDEPAVLGAVALRLADALRDSSAIVATTRDFRPSSQVEEQLAFGSRITAALVSIVGSAARSTALDYVLAKGGITSSEIARQAFGLRRVYVQGTLLPGALSIWRPDVTSKANTSVSQPPVYVVAPGNVGSPHALADAVDRLEFGTTAA